MDLFIRSFIHLFIRSFIHLFIPSGFLLPAEEHIMEAIKTIPAKNKYFIPLLWSNCIVILAKKRGKIKDDMAVQRLVMVS